MVLPHLSGALPLGFIFTFQAVAYAIDVKKNGKGEKNFGYFFRLHLLFLVTGRRPNRAPERALPQAQKTLLMQRGMAREGIYQIIKGMVKSC